MSEVQIKKSNYGEPKKLFMRLLNTFKGLINMLYSCNLFMYMNFFLVICSFSWLFLLVFLFSLQPFYMYLFCALSTAFGGLLGPFVVILLFSVVIFTFTLVILHLLFVLFVCFFSCHIFYISCQMSVDLFTWHTFQLHKHMQV